MFRASLCPSSGAQEHYTVVAACGILCCGFQVAGLVWRMLQHGFMALLSLCSFIPVKVDTLLPTCVASKEFLMLLYKCFGLFVCLYFV